VFSQKTPPVPSFFCVFLKEGRRPGFGAYEISAANDTVKQTTLPKKPANIWCTWRKWVFPFRDRAAGTWLVARNKRLYQPFLCSLFLTFPVPHAADAARFPPKFHPSAAHIRGFFTFRFSYPIQLAKTTINTNQTTQSEAGPSRFLWHRCRLCSSHRPPVPGPFFNIEAKKKKKKKKNPAISRRGVVYSPTTGKTVFSFAVGA